MDTLRGQFDPADFSEEPNDFDFAEADGPPEQPPRPIGQDERRMQVRAYNHWAGLIGDRNFPSIEDLDPETLDDFGPYGVLLDFTDGIEDPRVRYLGSELAAECDTTQGIEQLSDVPSRSLLTRITDHYMQILANQAPIGFEAEFVNQRERTILYRGILLPYSSDNETIDFIFGVINWKEVADQHTTDELMLEIDQALETGDGATDETGDNVLDLSHYNAEETSDDTADEAPLSGEESSAVPESRHATRPTFGSLLNPEGYEDEDEDEDEDDFVLPSDWRLSDPTAETDGDYADDSADVYDEDFDPDMPEADEEGPELGLSRLIESEFERAERAKHKPIDLAALADADAARDNEETAPAPIELTRDEFAPETFPEPVEPADAVDSPDEGETGFAQDLPFEPEPEAKPLAQSLPEIEPAAAEDAEEVVEPADEANGLYDCLAEARELAQLAQYSEERSRTALYAAVGRAYDVSLAAGEAPEDFAELLEENGLAVQERAPMTPIVKLVFGADYDKTRVTEYAATLSHAHRIGIEYGQLASYLAQAKGGLKGVVQEERRLRREEAGKPVEPRTSPRPGLAKKLRAIEGIELADVEAEGQEFALVMIRRTEDGGIVALGEIADDVPLIERVARQLLA